MSKARFTPATIATSKRLSQEFPNGDPFPLSKNSVYKKRKREILEEEESKRKKKQSKVMKPTLCFRFKSPPRPIKPSPFFMEYDNIQDERFLSPSYISIPLRFNDPHSDFCGVIVDPDWPETQECLDVGYFI